MTQRANLRLLALAAFAAVGSAVAGSAAAQVLDIGDNGAVTRYAGPAVYSDNGVRALVPLTPAPAISADAAQVALAIDESAQRHAVSPQLAQAVAWQESRFHQAAVSPKGALGVMQLMPATARRLGVDAADLKSNIDGGVTYLGQMLRRFEGDVPRALAAYNAGPKAVTRYGGVPPYAETKAYVQAILGRLSTVPTPAISVPRVGAE